MKKVPKKKWNLCPSCGMMTYSNQGLGNHRCPAKVRAKLDAQLDMIINEETSIWDADLRAFWNSNDVKFTQWLIENGRY